MLETWKVLCAVPGNAKTKTYIEFLIHAKHFKRQIHPHMHKFFDLDQEAEYPLHVIVEPLTDISKYLCSKVTCKKGSICTLNFKNDVMESRRTQYTVFYRFTCGSCNQAHIQRNLIMIARHEIPLDLALNKSASCQLCVHSKIRLR